MKNKTNKIKMVAGLLSLVLLAGLFAACNKNTSTVEEGKIVISVADFDDADINPKAHELQMQNIKNFEATHPNIKIEPVYWAFETRSYMAKAEGNTLPTTYYIPMTEASKIIDMGYAYDLTDEFKAHGFYENTKDHILADISRDGKIYYVPRSSYDMGLVINLNLYKEAGYVAEDGTPYQPETWEDLARVAKDIKEKTGKAGFVIPTTQNCGGWHFTSIAWSYGTVFEEKVNDKWEAKFDSEEFVDALQFVKDLKWKYDVLPANTLVTLDDSVRMVGSGEAAMSISQADQVNQLSRHGISINDIGIIKLPAGPDRRVSLMGGGYQVIDRNATKEQVKAVFEWLEFCGYTTKLTDERRTSLENSVEVAAADGRIVGIESLSPWNADSEVEAFKKQLYKENMNVNENHIKLYNDKTGIEFQSEEPIDAQALYSVLDSCIQEVFTNKDADCAKIAKDAASDFQKNHLDYAE